MIKKLDILIIRSFVGPFVVTFFVSLFVLIMQFFWLYMDEMIGKGISIWSLLQLLVYMSTTLVPLALPLSILLSSIMTFGNMGENFELVAIKSSGISLLRFLRPLFIFIVFISGLAFLFSNNVIPIANLKALSLLYDVRNAKPTLNIRPDQFNVDIPGYAIRVGSKDKDGKTIRDVIIYDHTDLAGNNKVITAKEGQILSEGKTALIFKLKDGWRYEEGYEHGAHTYTQTRVHFAKWDKIFDLSTFKFTRTNEDQFKNAYQMMNVSQLSENIDSLKRTKGKLFNSVTSYMTPFFSIAKNGKQDNELAKKMNSSSRPVRKYDSSFVQFIPDSIRASAINLVLNNIRSFKSSLDIAALDKKLQIENYLKFDVEWHRKFTLSFACILLFLIGAPLGAIIRKGGLGMPLVIAVVFFMLFHILNITGEKLAKSTSVDPWIGMWMSTAMLLPIAAWLINAARNDSQIFNKELYLRIWRFIKDRSPIKNKAVA
ncbi:MAG: permease [Flavipsychrobacter sp.]|nr:permease [Flavipsychrobacter sp.]